MIIVDLSGIMIANLYEQLKFKSPVEDDATSALEPDLLRHMILNKLRSIRVKFKREGEMVIAVDGRSWRRDVYAYYKANRDKKKKTSTLDWNKIFEAFNMICDELAENFPYRVVKAQGAEADDVIATLVYEFGSDSPLVMSGSEKIVIVSADKDFAQLHRFGNVIQHDPIKKKDFVVPNPDDYLLEHIINGDSGDGVPNILSDDDTFVVPGKRQKPMTKPRLAGFLTQFAGIPKVKDASDPIARNFERNRILIDLRNVPESVKKEVLASYESQAGKDRSKIFGYMMSKRLRNLMENIGDF